MTKYLLGVVLVLLAGYGALEAWPLVAGPSLRIDSPIEGANVPGGILEVSGRAVRANSLTLDGASLLPDQKGVFSATLTLSAGGSILTFVATDRFGRSIIKTRDIFVPTATSTSTHSMDSTSSPRASSGQATTTNP